MNPDKYVAERLTNKSRQNELVIDPDIYPLPVDPAEYPVNIEPKLFS